MQYWLKKEAFHIELAEDIYPYVNVYERYFQNLTTAWKLETFLLFILL